jgi:type I restriction enzyme, S subunit
MNSPSEVNKIDVNEVWYGLSNDDWDYKKIKYVFDERKETNNPIKTEELISLTMEDGVVPHSMKTGSGGNKPKEDLSKYKVVHPGDIVINPMNVIVGSVGLSKYYGILSPVYITLTPKEGSGKVEFYDYLFSTELFQKSLMGMGNGILIRESESSGKLNTIRMRIPMEKLGNHFLPIPPKEEQSLVVSYLDKKTQQIDDLIKKVNQKIKLLKEQRTSLINEVVTKGLNPNVEMKDSGVEWIGDIPSHWEFIRLKYLFSLEGGKDSKDIQNDDGEYPILGTGGEIDRGTEFLYDKPTLLLGRKGTIDKPYLMKNPFWVSDVMYYTIQKTDMTPDYLLLLFKTVPFNYYVYGSTQPSMSRLDYESMYFPVPPSKEQNEITKHLEIKTQEIDQSISSEQKRVNLLKEYKQSLLSEVVTGKTRVTEDMV